jgi:hypothetical protein
MSHDHEQTSRVTSFYLMRGGPVYRWMVKHHLHGEEDRYEGRRSLLMILVTWVPPFLLSLAQGLALQGTVKLPFLYDFATHVNFLVALPLLIFAERVIEPDISKGLSEFLERGLIRDNDREAYDSILAWANRKCDSGWSELIIAILAVIPFIFVRGAHWTERLTGTWGMAPSGKSLSLAGFWALFVSAFFVRVILFRWVWRLIIWTRLLSRLARLDLNTVATHPDRAGGLGFVGEVETTFGVLSFAIGTMTSADVASNILFENATLASEQLVVIAFIVGATLVFLLPLLTLAGTLHRTRRKGLHEYGSFASGYDQQFYRKWVQRRNSEGEPLLGTPDIPSLANLGVSFQTIHKMRFLPIDRRSIMILTISAGLPMLPLVFLDPRAMEIAEKLISRLL